MAMRKPRTNSRLTTKTSLNQQDVAQTEDDGGDRGAKSRKRKLSDMLGPPWSKDDLELFYQAYRNFGKDWKKVAGSMHKRTMEMVEALYGMNRAYLSLPEGAASAAGLIAMMTDHYNILDESDEESSKEQTHPRLRARAAPVSNTNSGPSGFGGPSPVKKPRSLAAGRPWMVGKRTPRYPVGNHTEHKGKNKVVINKMPQEETSHEDDDLPEEVDVAATLVAGLRKAPSPLVLKNTSTRRNCRATFQNGHAKESSWKADSGGSCPKHTASTSGETGVEGSQESKEKPGKSSSSATIDETDLVDGVRGQASDGKSRWKRTSAKRMRLQNLEDKYDEASEQCSQIEIQEEDPRDDVEQKHIPGQKKKRNSVQRTKKRSRQLFLADQNSALDALVTLANLSLNGLVAMSEPCSDQEKDEERPQTTELNPQALKMAEKNSKEVEKREGQKKVFEEDEKSREPTVKEDSRVPNGLRQQSSSPPDSRKRKRKSTLEKAKSGAEDLSKAEPEAPPPKVETPVVLKPRRKLKTITVKPLLKGPKANKGGDGLDLELLQRAGQTSKVDDGSLPLKLRSKKKGVAEKGPVNDIGDVNTSGSPADIVKEAPTCHHTTAELGPFNSKARLIHCLSPKVRRWCVYEWFYSAIDLPWFARNEFVEYLNHAGLGHVPRLTRVEWGVIRSSLGRPRRLSDAFLKQERAKLAKYREDVRTHYHELRSGLREGLPSDLARPLTVGQRVIARHPKTGEIHDGSILTVDRSRCRVQFDRPELGVEFVMDIDAMPLHPLENMPEVMRRKRIVLDSMDRALGETKIEVKSRIPVSAGGAVRAALNERLERPGSIPGLGVFSPIFLTNLTRNAQANSVDSVRLGKTAISEAVAATQQALITQHCTPGQAQVREADIRTLVELGVCLNKKEALVLELCIINDECASNKGSDAFQRQHAAVLQQLKDVNDQIVESLKYLRHRYKYQDSASQLCHRIPTQGMIGGPSLAEGSLPASLEAGLSIAEVALSSMKHARAMVSVAVQSVSALKEGEDLLLKMGGALDSVTKGAPCTQAKSCSGIASSTQGLASAIAEVPPSATSQPTSGTDANGDTAKLSNGDGEANMALAGDTSHSVNEDAGATDVPNEVSQQESKEALVLSELMASCVATLLMVQTLTERQFPAPDVSLTLERALESLRPQAAQNHSLFKDIEQQLGYIKTQILAQIPIQSSVPFPVETAMTQPVNPT